MAEHPSRAFESKEPEAEEQKPTEPETELSPEVAAAFEASGLPAKDKAAFEAGYKAGSSPRPDLNR